jgi:hypothetical protein
MLEVIEKKGNNFIVKDSESGHVLKVVDTFTDRFPMLEISPANPLFFCS